MRGLLREPTFWVAFIVANLLVFIVRTPIIWVPLVIVIIVGLIVKLKSTPQVGPITKYERWRQQDGEWVKVEESGSPPENR